MALVQIDAGEGTMPGEDLGAILDDGLHPIAAWRRYRGLSQAELARRTGLSQVWLSRIESGEGTARRRLGGSWRRRWRRRRGGWMGLRRLGPEAPDPPFLFPSHAGASSQPSGCVRRVGVSLSLGKNEYSFTLRAGAQPAFAAGG